MEKYTILVENGIEIARKWQFGKINSQELRELGFSKFVYTTTKKYYTDRQNISVKTEVFCKSFEDFQSLIIKCNEISFRNDLGYFYMIGEKE